MSKGGSGSTPYLLLCAEMGGKDFSAITLKKKEKKRKQEKAATPGLGN